MIRPLILGLLVSLQLWCAQYGLPTADSGSTSWTACTGDGDGVWFEELDEGFGAGRGSGSGPDDSTTLWSTSISASTIATTLASVTDPASSSGHVIRGRHRKVNYGASCSTGSSGGAQYDVAVELLEGASVRASSSSANVGSTYVTLEYTLSGAEADSITDYSALIVRSTCTKVGGGPAAGCSNSAHELEVPNVAGGTSIKDPIMRGVIVRPR